MKLNLKYTSALVDDIEKAKGNISIENCIADNTINNLALLIQKGLIDDNGIHGVSKSVALNKLDEYLAEKDKDELLLDITEALVDGGFLSRKLDVNLIREAQSKKMDQVKNYLKD